MKRVEQNLQLCADNRLSIEVFFVYTEKTIDPSLARLREVAERYAHHPIEIQLLPCAEPGIYAAMNTGIAMARGTYLLFLGADDRLLQEFVTAFRTLAQLPICACVLADARLPTHPEDAWHSIRRSGGRAGQWHWLLGMPRIHQAILYERSFLLRHHLKYSTILRICSDYILTSEVLLLSGENIRLLEHCTVVYNTSGFSSRYKTRQLYREHVMGYWQSQHLRVYTPLVIATRALLLAYKTMINMLPCRLGRRQQRVSP